MATKTGTLTDRIVGAIQSADWNAITETYAADVLLDMNLPTWRFQLQGRDAAARYFTETTRNFANLRTTQYRVHSSPDEVIIEAEMRFDGEGGEHLWRAIDVFRVDGDEVTEHTEYCTGCWSPADIARQAAEAPIIRW